MEDTHKKNTNLRLLYLLVIPLILVSLFIKLNSVRGPYYLGGNSDPEYAYLLNSLKISEFKAPFHIDHPGTTLQLLGGLTIKTFNFNKSTGDAQVDVITNSEKYLSRINILLLCLIILASTHASSDCPDNP